MYTSRFVLYYRYSTTKKPCKILKILIYSMTFYALFCFLLTLFIALERLKYLSNIFFDMWYDWQWNNFWIVFSRYKTASVSPMVIREDPSSPMTQGKENGRRSRYRFTQISSCTWCEKHFCEMVTLHFSVIVHGLNLLYFKKWQICTQLSCLVKRIGNHVDKANSKDNCKDR